MAISRIYKDDEGREGAVMPEKQVSHSRLRSWLAVGTMICTYPSAKALLKQSTAVGTYRHSRRCEVASPRLVQAVHGATCPAGNRSIADFSFSVFPSVQGYWYN